MATPALLEVRGLTKEYPGVRALAGVDFEVRPGEVHCIVGPNGAGKSTLIKCISGVVDPTDGEILLDGEPLARGNPSAAIGRGVATIYQELDLVADLTGRRQHLPRPRAPRARVPRPRPACAARRPRCCARISHEAIAPSTRVSDLRPAGQQIVSIARSLSHEVRLLIMDEPSAILDDSEIETLFDVVRRLTAEGVGVVYISHRLDEIRRIGDRVTVLREGATVVSGLPASTPADELVTHMVGHRLRAAVPGAGRRGGGRVLLEVRDLQRLPDVKAASFDLHAGEVLGIAGLVGAGRSELLRAIYGVDRRDSGEVVLDGEPLPPGRPDRAIAAGLGLAPEDRKSQALLLEWDLTKNVTLPDVARFQRGVIRVQGRAGGGRDAARGAAHHAVRRQPAGSPAVRAATSRRSCWPAGC